MMRLTGFGSQAAASGIGMFTRAASAFTFSRKEKAMKIALVSLLAVVLMSTASFGDYSNSFEYDDWDDAVADGWSYVGANEPVVDFVTGLPTGNAPTHGDKALELALPNNGGIRRTVFDEDIKEYVISFDWYVLNPNSSEAGVDPGPPVVPGTSQGYNNYFQLNSADGATGVRVRAHHFSESRVLENGITQDNAMALNMHGIANGSAGPADQVSYGSEHPVWDARFFNDGWNSFEIWASAHPTLEGDWLRFYLNGVFVGESNPNWFNWNNSLSSIEFGWTSLGANTGYFDNFNVTTPTAGLEADFDQDDDVDGNDFLIWQRGVGSAGGPSQGDANDDGLVDGLDRDVWKSQFGSPSASVAAGAIPEPSALALALSSAWLAGGLFQRGGAAHSNRKCGGVTVKIGTRFQRRSDVERFVR